MEVSVQYLILALTVAYCVASNPQCPPTNDPENVIHYPHPTDCDKFLTCDWGNLVEQKCPEGQFWNDNKKYCDYPENVNCAGVPTTNSPQTNVPTKTSPAVPPTKTPSGTNCPENYDPDHQTFMPHVDCTKFYICSWGGVAIERVCPPELHWNPAKNYCDFPSEAGCGATSVERPTTQSPVVTNVPSATDGCPEVYDPYHQVYFPHEDCSKYYICTYEGNKLEQNCPPNLHWSQYLGYCDRPEVANCKLSSE